MKKKGATRNTEIVKGGKRGLSYCHSCFCRSTKEGCAGSVELMKHVRVKRKMVDDDRKTRIELPGIGPERLKMMSSALGRIQVCLSRIGGMIQATWDVTSSFIIEE